MKKHVKTQKPVNTQIKKHVDTGLYVNNRNAKLRIVLVQSVLVQSVLVQSVLVQSDFCRTFIRIIKEHTLKFHSARKIFTSYFRILGSNSI